LGAKRLRGRGTIARHCVTPIDSKGLLRRLAPGRVWPTPAALATLDLSIKRAKLLPPGSNKSLAIGSLGSKLGDKRISAASRSCANVESQVARVPPVDDPNRINEKQKREDEETFTEASYSH
jgi:hypothetical protein